MWYYHSQLACDHSYKKYKLETYKRLIVNGHFIILAYFITIYMYLHHWDQLWVWHAVPMIVTRGGTLTSSHN